MRFPSVKTLQNIEGVGKDEAKRIRLWMSYAEMLIKVPLPEPLPPGLQKTGNRRLTAHAVIAWIITKGRDTSWEACQEMADWDSPYNGPGWEAVDKDDPYAITLIYRNGGYRVGCWGELPEVAR